VQLRSAGQTDVGKVREQNEDSYCIVDEVGLFVVADGMGGHLGGRMASTMAVQTVERMLAQREEEIVKGAQEEPLISSAVPRVLAETVRLACATIYQKAQEDSDFAGMGTTCTVLLIRSSRAFVAHVGDSRCYLQRGEQMIQITDDHSLVNEQLKAGLITREQARSSRLKNIITRSVGFEEDVAVDTYAFPLQRDDKILMCSDGLANIVDDAEMGLALNSHALGEVPKKMVDLANERGGDDNITVVCVHVES
jgi:PPM family protein phosphatase